MSKINLTALSNTVVERDQAVITGDGFVNSVVPGWSNCEVNVVINEAMGANFCQLLITLNNQSQLKGKTRLYERYTADTDRWVSLAEDSPKGEQVYPVPLSDLP